ncbi:hypothetical protein V2G26_020620 [Clonostachys chloroleuca]|uniref:CRIB domain-containing protein n=1 Tax=Clonostachys chloroleuca TaxID=1926264 RepID=A0AA35PXV2_9HYPO|nr:unnamed protein product [Clonostachys chloroleuca]
MAPSEFEGGRRRVASRDGLKTSFSKPFTSHGQKPSLTSISPIEPYNPDIDYMMEPAVDGPPSPERLRQLSNQMKRASNMNRTQGHRAVSSASSPRRAIGIDRPQWEQSIENASSLTRRSSSRSSDSNAPSRGRSERESVQALGRNFFQRSNTATSQMSKRTSSPYSSSGSSMYSAEGPSETGFKDSIIPNIFTRRKQSRDDSIQKKLQISGPFNFQHVTHTNRGHLSTMPSDIADLGVCGDAVSSAGVPGLGLHDAPFFKGSSESLDTEPSLSAPPSRASFVPRHGMPVAGPRRMLKTAKSQDQLRSMATSPPLSSISSDVPSPPVPPRSSSRQSALPDTLGSAASRAMQAAGFRQPQPYSPSLGNDQTPSPPPDMGTGNEDNDRRFSHAITTAGDTAWPLSAAASPLLYDQVLADVPEEEEQQQQQSAHEQSRQSLRGSHSVPILRNFLERPSSATSDTLGEVVAPRAVDADAAGDATGHMLHDDNWEDVIDYCYEHEAEANFDYQWDRPSMDVTRDLPPESPKTKKMPEALDYDSVVAPGFTSTLFIDEPTSNFSSRASSAAGHASVGNTPHLMPTNNFSLPRGDNRAWKSKSARPTSYASTYKESQGFNLSPSLLIPGDYHQQMMMTESERYEYQGENDVYEEAYRGPYHDDTMGKEPLQSYLQRSSTSTTETVFSSDTTGERHVSANSTFTTLTRLTMSSSTTSLNKVAGIVAEEQPTQSTDAKLDQNDKVEEEELGSKDTVGDLTPFPVPPFAKKPFHKSHASESIDRSALQAQEMAKPRRPRARTSSLSAQVTPPIGQYALFPRAPVKGTGDRI